MDGYAGLRLGAGDGAIPKDLAALLPNDPTEQLELAHRIVNLAYSSKVAALEQENNSLRQTLMQRQSQMKALERRISSLELEASDAQEKARHSMEEQTKLVGEKNALIGTVKKLNRDLAKLDSFKRNLLQSLQDEEDAKEGMPSMALPITDYSGDRLVHSVLSSVHSSPQRYHHPPATVTPSLKKDSPGSANPSASPWTAGASGTAVSGVPEGSPRVDGKEFFRQARARLAYEQFSQFLQNIKELNAHRQTREETLKKASEIFGSENGDLYASFESLLSRHLPL